MNFKISLVILNYAVSPSPIFLLISTGYHMGPDSKTVPPPSIQKLHPPKFLVVVGMLAKFVVFI